MKTPRFWYRKKGLLSFLLSPLGQAYRAGSMLRRAFARTPYKAPVPVLCIGNIVAGGAGKTPTCLAFKKLISKNDPQAVPVFVTRGYGGSEKGPLRVDPAKHTAYEVGDEALLLARAAPCWIGRDRAATLCEASKEASVIIMDDGLQNPTITPDLSFLVIDGAVGLGNGKLIPAGPLRETLNDAFARIDGIILIGEDNQQITAYLGKPVIKAKMQPGISSIFLNKPKVLAFAGIGRPEKFYASCREAGLTVVLTHDFPDHHVFTPKDMKKLMDAAQGEDLRLITTSKDFVRIPQLYRDSVAVLDIKLVFEDDDRLRALVAARPVKQG